MADIADVPAIRETNAEEDEYDERLAQEFQDQIDKLRAARNDEDASGVAEEDEDNGQESIAIPNSRRRSSLIVDPTGNILKKFASPSIEEQEQTQAVKLLSPEEKRDLIQIFNLFDTDGSGTMEMGELKVVLWALGFQPEPGEPEEMISNYFKISTEEADDICLSVDDFLLFAVDLIGNRDQSDVLKKSFGCFDEEEKGFLVMKDLRRVCKEINENFSDEDLEMMFQFIDKDGGGSVTLDEWITVMSETI